jgi:hypothetical protein
MAAASRKFRSESTVQCYGANVNGASSLLNQSESFSYATLTTVGYGDLVAATNLGRSLAITEALLARSTWSPSSP